MGDLRNNGKVTEISIDEQKEYNSAKFPQVIVPKPEFSNNAPTEWCKWVKENRVSLKNDLLKHGAILFRGFNLPTAEDFDSFVKSFDIEPFPYVGGAAPRRVITGNVFTANEAPSQELIPFHHEMAQVPNFPKVLFFYCKTAPPEGGQTPIVHSNMAYQYMLKRAPEFVQRLETEGVKYIRILPENDDPLSPIGRSWKSTYLTEDKDEASKKATDQGTEIEWVPDGCLKTTTKVLPAVRTDERTGKKTWFNSIIAAYLGWQDCRNDRKKAVTFANGDPMSAEHMAILNDTLEELAVAFTWQAGDVLMVDNRQALHSRRSFTPPRAIYACLCKEFD